MRTCAALVVVLAAGCSHSSSPQGAPDAGAPDGGCIGAQLVNDLGKSTLLVGASMEDATAAAAHWDVRYLYIAGGIADGSGPCASCPSHCSSSGQSCSSASGCPWWGCYQDISLSPGQYIDDFIGPAESKSQAPMFTYYELLQSFNAIGGGEGTDEVTVAARNAGLLARYFADYRFLLQKIGSHRALLQLEPDFWGYAQQAGSDPHALAAAVASANPTDCGAYENSIAGLGRCLIAMARKYAPNARVGLHGSSWGPGVDATRNADPSVDIGAEGRKLGAFLAACGAGDGDFVTVDASDRDAGYYQLHGESRFWDATNATIPSFHQAFAWAKSLAESLDKPILFWQVPVGNAAQGNTPDHWKDNRVDYFFGHTAELAAAHVAGMFFGAGAGDQTTPESDGGNLLSKAKAYLAAGGQSLCQ